MTYFKKHPAEFTSRGNKPPGEPGSGSVAIYLIWLGVKKETKNDYSRCSFCGLGVVSMVQKLFLWGEKLITAIITNANMETIESANCIRGRTCGQFVPQ